MCLRVILLTMALGALAGCAGSDRPILLPVSDLPDRIPDRPTLDDGCAPGEAPEPEGAWWSCTALTRRDAETVAGVVAAWDDARRGRSY